MLVTPGPPPTDGTRDPAADSAHVARAIAAQAPRLFAVAERTLEPPIEVRVVGWGMAFPHHADVVSVGGDMRASLEDAETAESLFLPEEERMVTRVVWLPHPA